MLGWLCRATYYFVLRGIYFSMFGMSHAVQMKRSGINISRRGNYLPVCTASFITEPERSEVTKHHIQIYLARCMFFASCKHLQSSIYRGFLQSGSSCEIHLQTQSNNNQNFILHSVWAWGNTAPIQYYSLNEKVIRRHVPCARVPLIVRDDLRSYICYIEHLFHVQVFWGYLIQVDKSRQSRPTSAHSLWSIWDKNLMHAHRAGLSARDC